jgi:hypothetical protein
MVTPSARIGVEAGRPGWHAARAFARCVPEMEGRAGPNPAILDRSWVGVAHAPEPALAASAGLDADSAAGIE